jgi:hypothetical protein
MSVPHTGLPRNESELEDRYRSKTSRTRRKIGTVDSPERRPAPMTSKYNECRASTTLVIEATLPPEKYIKSAFQAIDRFQHLRKKCRNVS